MYDADEPQYDGTVAHDVIEPGTFFMFADGYSYDETYYDDYDGYLYDDDDEEVGTINYITGGRE
jgi:hypothetical protein